MNVKVWNDNIYPYTEDFRGTKYTIPAQSFIEMDEDEAEYFKATFTFPVKDSQGRPDPKFFKKIRIEIPEDVQMLRQQKDSLVCHANGQKAVSATELAQILGNFSHMLAGKDEAGEEEVFKKQNKDLKKENKELKARLDLIEQKLGLIGSNTNEESV